MGADWKLWCDSFRQGLALLISGIIFAFSTDSVSAQIIPDSTLGAESSVVNADTTINGSPASLINGGATRGINLFHSFGEFNVGDGQRVYFVNPSGIENIISRVTGSNASNILGTLGITGGNANLFLINPNGVIFGQNARLDIGGSFVASTVNAIQFGNNGFFSATNPDAPSQLLTINPSALFLNQISRGEITNRSVAPAGQNLIGEDITGLRVPDGKSLLLLGGNVNLEGGGLRAYEGRIELNGLAAPGSVGLNVVGNTLGFSVPEGVMRGNVSLSNGAEVNVRGAGAGDIVVTGRDITIAGGSLVRAGIDKDLGTSQTRGGDIQINATGAIVLTGNGSRIANVLDERAFGKAGNININAETFSISDDAYVASNTFGKGDGGNIFVKVNNAVSLTGDSGIFSNVETGAVGKGGDINIQAGSLALSNSTIVSDVEAGAVGKGGDINIQVGSLSLTNGAQLSLSIFGQGNAGNVSIRANGSASFVNSTIFNTLEAGAEGKGGDINIQAGSLSLTDGTQLQTLIRQTQNNLPGGVGNGGNVKVDVSGAVTIAGVKDEIPSGIRSSVGTGAKGNAGNLTITADSFSLTDNATLNLSTFGQGNAGNVSIQANGSVSLINGNIYSTVGAGAEGDGGDINVKGASLSLTNNAEIKTSISQADPEKNLLAGKGNGGNVNIDVSGKVTFANPSPGKLNGINTEVQEGATGNGGSFTINAGSLEVTGGSEIQSSTRGEGNSGTITINARESISFDGSDGKSFSRAINTVQPGAEGNAGGIGITTSSLSLTNGAFLSSSTFGKGNAGNISIDARNTINFDSGGYVQSNVFDEGEGKAGNIRVTTGSLSLTNGGQLTANVRGKGEAGNIIIEARDTVTLDGRGALRLVVLKAACSLQVWAKAEIFRLQLAYSQ
jgi:filamentous hemagglutinin family protein